MIRRILGVSKTLGEPAGTTFYVRERDKCALCAPSTNNIKPESGMGQRRETP